MAQIDSQKKFKIRWTDPRYRDIQQLGWDDLDEGSAIDKALDRSKKIDQIDSIIDRAFENQLNMLQAITQINEVLNNK